MKCAGEGQYAPGDVLHSSIGDIRKQKYRYCLLRWLPLVKSITRRRPSHPKPHRDQGRLARPAEALACPPPHRAELACTHPHRSPTGHDTVYHVHYVRDMQRNDMPK